MICMSGRCSNGIMHIFCGEIHDLTMTEISFEDFPKQISAKIKRISALQEQKMEYLEFDKTSSG